MNAVHLVAGLLVWLAALGMLLGQEQPREADRAASTREGGIPRDALGPERERDREDGLEEGTPDTADARFKEKMPRWRPPRGDWKLGVWAYNTETGVVVTRVAPGSAAAREGLEPGDRIVSVGGYQVGYVGDLLYPLGFELQRHAGSRGDVLLLVQNVRGNELLNLNVQLDRGGRPIPLPMPREPE
jgi:membrane-associated protease RseP (regulator of RpoE activity)